MFGCRSELYFDRPDAAVNLARWQALNDHKDEITAAFGDELTFDELPNNKGCRIEARLNGPKINDRQRWREVIDWMLDTQTRLRHAVSLVGGVPGVTTLTADTAGSVAPRNPTAASEANDAAST